jgi:hypothetical protein
MRKRACGGAAIAVLILAATLPCAIAQAAIRVKTWSFTLPHGTLEIELQRSQDGGIQMYVSPTHQGYEAPIAEQVQPLKEVLGAMPALGLDAHKLDYLGTRTWSQDVEQKLAYACADSREWRLSVQNHTWKAQGLLVISLLNRSGAFEPYNEAFKDYGIQVRVTDVEIPGLGLLSEFPPRNSRDRADGKLGVPAATSVSMRFSPIGAPTKQ